MNSQVNGDCNEVEVAEPLEKKNLPFTENGINVEISALDKKWIIDRCFLPYIPPPQKINGSFLVGAKENWLDQISTFNLDMSWLLQLKQHQFWSQVMYDSCTMAAVVSFLQEGFPFYAMNDFPNDDEIMQVYQETYRLVLLVITRLATNKESKTSFMTEKFYGELIYQNYVFTVPILLDLCLLYGHNNRSILIRVFNSVFKAQPLYHEDLERSVPFIIQVLYHVSQLVGLKMPLDSEPERITTQSSELTPNTLADLILHILDTMCTLSVLTDVFSQACKIFHQNSMEVRLVWFYENALPELYRKLESLVKVDEDCELFVSLKNKLDLVRVELLKTFRNILFCNINSAIESSDPTEKMNSVDDYVTVLTECLAEKLFVRDYHMKFNVGQDLDLLSQLSPDMDTDKRSYILEAVIDSIETPDIPSSLPSSPVLPSKLGNNRKTNSEAERNQPSTSCAGVQDIGAGSLAARKKVAGVKLDSLISQVKDILPHLGDGFIEKCLDHYNYVSEDVINAILEGKLPSSLSELNHELPIIPPEKEPSVPAVENEVVSDDDEPKFAHAHKGKRKDIYRDVMMLINDKSHREALRDFYTPYSLYDDDYDDTYDDRLGGTMGDDEDLERNNSKISDRSHATPAAITSGGGATAVSSSEDNDSDEGVSKDHFIENPEKIRALQEQRRLARGGYGQSRKDVVGKAKGQGQDKNVIINRNQKTAHKSQRANHNRRAGAQWKRQRGMLPS